MRRREFITLLGGAAAAWPLAARAQQPERVRRIGVLAAAATDDPERRPARGVPAGPAAIGLDDGRNVRIEIRWGAAMPTAFANRRRIGRARAGRHPGPWRLACGAVAAEATRTVPIVFANVADPVGAGFVESLARPGGNVTGFMQFEYGMAAKWLELLKEMRRA